ncbi:hypothetical protein [Nitrosopumilus piranensis]|uniref:Uncharacterized protein n=1 Tax=Nitrosopumilus piranensis TaxID=1582439 RepID=A0A0C5BUV8_9ARCH|nr:hypothetical protein [Nitrosopumilus piranensis]AJM91994.1 conserved exported protein of unknown function [Nitrosopumilus piranensis]
MKIKFLIPIGIVMMSSISIFAVFNGYSLYGEGISLRMYDESSKDHYTNPPLSEFQIVTLDESDFEKVPKIKVMMDVLLDQQFNPQRNGYRVMGPDFTSYWINTSIDELSIQTGMSQTELNDYEKWHENTGIFLFRYNDAVFHFGVWVT